MGQGDEHIGFTNIRVVDEYICDLKNGAILIVDSNSVTIGPKPDTNRLYPVPTVELSHEIGAVKFQNAVALGALYPLIKNLLTETSVRQALSEGVPLETVDENIKAFDKGMEYIQAHFTTD